MLTTPPSPTNATVYRDMRQVGTSTWTPLALDLVFGRKG